MLLSIDPSFTGTGVVIKDTNFIYQNRYTTSNKIYTSIDKLHANCVELCDYIKSLLNSYDITDVIIEYPVIHSISGSYLMCLHGYLFSLFKQYRLRVISIPPMACDSFTKNKTHKKSHLVDYCKTKGWIDKRVSHDICTAMIFCELYQSILDGSYKNSFVLEDYVKES